VKLTERQLERILNDKNYWATVASEIIAEASQNVPHGNSDSAIAGIVAQPLPLGRILESHSPQQTRVRFPLPGSGPRFVPMISEVETVSTGRGVLLTQREARRLRRQWDRGRLRGQEQAQHLAERGEEEEEGDSPMQDHPGKSCSDAHAGMSHKNFLDQQEEEEESEEENVNPLFRDRRNTFDTTRPGGGDR
jgi:hypothetical protein